MKEENTMTYLAKDLRMQADYVRNCLQSGHLGYADSKMLGKLEQAASRISNQVSDLSELNGVKEKLEEENRSLAAENQSLEETNLSMRDVLEQIVETLSSTLARKEANGSYQLFETLDMARKALK